MLRKTVENQRAVNEAFQERGTSYEEKMQIVKMVEAATKKHPLIVQIPSYVCSIF